MDKVREKHPLIIGSNMEKVRHIDPLNLSRKYDLTRYMKIIPKIEASSNSRKTDKKTINKEKLEAQKQRQKDAQNTKNIHLQSSIMNLFDLSMNLHRQLKDVDIKLADWLSLPDKEKQKLCALCNIQIRNSYYHEHLIKIHKNNICFRCRKMTPIAKMKLRTCFNCYRARKPHSSVKTKKIKTKFN